MPRKRTPSFRGVQARLVFPDQGQRQAVLDLMRRFSAGVRFAYSRLLEGKDRKELKRGTGPLCHRFGLNTRYADDAILKAQAVLDSARELGADPRKVVFGGRKVFEQLKRRHLSGRALKRLKSEWRERRQGLLYARGDGSKGGNLNARLEVYPGALWLRVNLGHGKYARAAVHTRHPDLKALLQRVYSSLPYTVELSSREGLIYAHFTWEEALPSPVFTKENGVLALDVNADPYSLALAVVAPDGNLKRYSTLSLEEVDRAQNRGAKELCLWSIAHRVVSLAEEHGVALATERLKNLPKGTRGDGLGRAFRRKAHRFAYRSLLRKVHALAARKGVEVLPVNPQDTSTIGMLKYAPERSLSKDVAAAYVIGRRALGLVEKLPQGYRTLLQDETFQSYVQGFYACRIEELEAKKAVEPNRYRRRGLHGQLKKTRARLNLVQSLGRSPGSREGSTDGRNPSGHPPWRVLRVGTFLPLLGREVPRDLSRLKPILHGSWEGWKGNLGPPPGGGPECAHGHLG